MAVIVVTHERSRDHDPGAWHPERPARLDAVLAGVARSPAAEDVVRVTARPATIDELIAVHPRSQVMAIERLAESGGGPIDGDTVAGPGSFDAAVLAAGAGLTAVEQLDAGAGAAAFCAVRPPGHHARPRQAMGFCLFNNIAVTAVALAARGERVLIVDWDAHHGNGTQDVFYDDPRVVFVSLHQWPLYPGTGDIDETGSGAGVGTTANVPLPAGATGDVYLRAVDEVLGPLVERHRPTWLLVSAGFDAHRADPLTDLGLTAGDFGLLTSRVASTVPAGRRILFLEGGYDLDALRLSTAATMAALAGERFLPEPPSAGGPGASVVADAALRVED